VSAEPFGTDGHAADEYRYRLDWPNDPPVEGERAALFVMLNPATARKENDTSGRHRTRDRCIDFARRWGCERLITVNLFAWRAGKPHELAKVADPIGPKNDSHIIAAAHEAVASGGLLICAWGDFHGLVKAGRGWAYRDRDRAVMRLLATTPAQPMALGTTDNGSPLHPLYVRADRILVPYRGRP
jgi:hypothetical protein